MDALKVRLMTVLAVVSSRSSLAGTIRNAWSRPREHLALQAVVHHHNRLSATFSDQPDRYRPMFKPHREVGLAPPPWWLGFTAGIELAPRFWKNHRSAPPSTIDRVAKGGTGHPTAFSAAA
jgi:hypothetical protein